MRVSSLVFVAIIAAWAAYLLPQWLRRRDAAGQSRGPDRDSENLRVLTRRERAAALRSTGPLLSDPRAMPGNASSTLGDAETALPGRRRVEGIVEGSGPAAVAARRRARVLSILLAATALCWALVPLAQVTWTATMPATGLLLADLAALMITGRRRAVRRAMLERQRRAEAARRQSRRQPPQRSSAPARPTRRTAPATPVEAGAEPPTRVTASPAIRPERASERVARELDGVGGSWVPIPVPPPTYTLKPMAPRPEPGTDGLPGAPAPEHELAHELDDEQLADQPSTSEALAAAEAPAGEEPPASATGSSAGSGTAGEGREPGRAPRPWEDDRTFADDLDLDAVLARRRAVNG